MRNLKDLTWEIGRKNQIIKNIQRVPLKLLLVILAI